MHGMCNLIWKEGRVPDDWTRTIIVTAYKGKGDKSECGDYKEIKLLSIPGKVYGRVLIESAGKLQRTKLVKNRMALEHRRLV